METLEQNISDCNYYMNIRQFPDGTCEAITKAVRPMAAAMLDKARLNRMIYGNPPAEEKSDTEKAANWSRAVRRSRQTVRWLCKQMKADRLFTLTYRENQTDRDQVRKDFTRFLRLVRAELGDWAYVAVLERQERGAYHIHCAVRGWQRISVLRACWYKALGASPDVSGADTPGNIDVTRPRGRWSSGAGRSWNSTALGKYIGKYMSKTFEDIGGEKKRYWHSTDVVAPVVHRVWLGSAASPVDAIRQSVSILQVFYGLSGADWEMWLSPDWTSFWLSGSVSSGGSHALL